MIFVLYFQGGLFKWQYLRERHPKQEEIRDAQLYGSSALLHFQNVLTAVSISSHTELAAAAECTMAEL